MYRYMAPTKEPCIYNELCFVCIRSTYSEMVNYSYSITLIVHIGRQEPVERQKHLLDSLLDDTIRTRAYVAATGAIALEDYWRVGVVEALYQCALLQ